MTVSIALSGFPDVYSCRIYQTSDATPARIVVECALGSSATIGDTTTLTWANTGFSGTWSNCKVITKPRVFGNKMKLVLENELNALRDMRFTTSYNVRNSRGEIVSNEASLADIWLAVGTLTGLTITVTTTPDAAYKPTCLWEGKPVIEAINELLLHTGSRMVYRPTTGAYIVNTGTGGTAFAPTNQVYQDAPDEQIKELHVDSGPNLYDAKLLADAKVEDASGDLQDLSTVADPIDIFKQFSAEGDADLRWKLRNTALRLWEVTGATYPAAKTPDEIQIRGTRAVSIYDGDEPVEPSAVAQVTGMTTWPHFQFVTQDESIGDIPLDAVPGTHMFIAKEPIIAVSSLGVILETIGILTSYYLIDGDDYERTRVTEAVNGTGISVVKRVEWLRYVDTETDDLGTSSWSTVHNQVSTAMVELYTNEPQFKKFNLAADHNGNGAVGAVCYEAVQGREGVAVWIAFNFVPSSWRIFK